MPLVSKGKTIRDQDDLRMKLTRNVGCSPELVGHLGIHGDHLVRLDLGSCVSVFDLSSYPISEWLTDHGSTDIYQPLLRCLRDVGRVGQELTNVGLLACERADVLDGQVVVAGHVEGLDLAVLEVALLRRHDVLELEAEQ